MPKPQEPPTDDAAMTVARSICDALHEIRDRLEDLVAAVNDVVAELERARYQQKK